MSSFEEKFLLGYKHAKFFDKFGKNVYSVLGDIDQCGFIDFCSSGEIAVAANRQEIGEEVVENKLWEKQNVWCYKKGLQRGEFDAGSHWYFRRLGIFDSKFDLCYLSYRENVSPDVQRLMFFCANDPKMYSNLINNFNMVKKMFSIFIAESNEIATACKEHMVDIGDESSNYFVNFNPKKDSDLDRINSLLRDLNILDDKPISTREWQCATLYARGKSARETGDILKISRRTVETHFENLKIKLNVSTKSEILDKLLD
ncbi:MAG: helix-turn-helix domain-containing protein [Legionellales bacterium]|nr:helix-turn-helix domain-containing protein [Legionellales bacterium]